MVDCQQFVVAVSIPNFHHSLTYPKVKACQPHHAPFHYPPLPFFLSLSHSLSLSLSDSILHPCRVDFQCVARCVLVLLLKNYSKRRSFKESKSRMHSQKSPHSTPSDKSAFVVNRFGRTAALLWTHPECSLYVRLIFTVVCLRSCGKQFHLPLLLLLPMDQQQQRYKQNT